MKPAYIAAALLTVLSPQQASADSKEHRASLKTGCQASLTRTNPGMDAAAIEKFCSCPVIWIDYLFVYRQRAEVSQTTQALLTGDFAQVARDAVTKLDDNLFARDQLMKCLEKYKP